MALLFLFVFLGCDAKSKVQDAQAEKGLRHRVAVANYPLYCMVSTICRDAGGPVEEVIYVGPPKGADPHSWMPPADQIRSLQKVDLIICNGPGAVFATWMDKVTIDESKLCNTTDAIKLTEFVLVKDYQLVHSHGPEGEHSHAWVVPQSWLSPRIARKQAKLCFDRLVTVYGQSSQLDNGFAELQKQFDSLESAHEEIKDRSPNLVIASSTPEIQYLTRSLDWEDRYLQWTEHRDDAKAKEELAAMRARVAKQDSEEGPEVASSEKLFLWSGPSVESLNGFVDSQWPSTVTIDLVDTPNEEGPSPDGYFLRMAKNLKLLGTAVE
jgi:zinc transport system substrate-binding protein